MSDPQWTEIECALNKPPHSSKHTPKSHQTWKMLYATHQLPTQNPFELMITLSSHILDLRYTYKVVTKVYMCLVPNFLSENAQRYLSEWLCQSEEKCSSLDCYNRIQSGTWFMASPGRELQYKVMKKASPDMLGFIRLWRSKSICTWPMRYITNWPHRFFEMRPSKV